MLSSTFLQRLAQLSQLPERTRKLLARSAQMDTERHRLQRLSRRLARGTGRIIIRDCKGAEDLPGSKVNHGTSLDPVVIRVRDTTKSLLDFCSSALGRNSIDDAGGDVRSSVHYSRGYCNAFWSNGRMVYGDGDGYLFNDFTCSDDFIGHELAHGVTASTSGLGYEHEYGALNESISDTLGLTFKQWRSKQDVQTAEWRIGTELIAEGGHGIGWTCIRDLSKPDGTHCLNRQPLHYKDYIQGGDPHDNSGIPNFAFYNAAMEIGGEGWSGAGLIWYAALCSGRLGSRPSFASFAQQTLLEAQKLRPEAVDKVRAAWQLVGVEPNLTRS